MDYKAIYDRLVEYRLQTPPDGFVEKHHIIPRCMGGRDIKTNIVSLTPEEHYFCHKLLCKIYPDNRKLLHSVVLMSAGKLPHRANNKLVGWVRRKAGEARRGVPHSDEHRRKNSLANTGRKKAPRTDEHRANISASKMGYKHSDAAKAKMSMTRKGLPGARKGKKYSPAWQHADEIISLYNSGVPEYKLKQQFKIGMNTVRAILGKPKYIY